VTVLNTVTCKQTVNEIQRVRRHRNAFSAQSTKRQIRRHKNASTRRDRSSSIYIVSALQRNRNFIDCPSLLDCVHVF